MEKHLAVCAGKTGINYVFDDGKILSYQDNYSKLSDLPFAVYYDFETATWSVTFFDAKMYLVNYCIIVAFEKYSLKLNKILDNFDDFCKSINQDADDKIIEKIKKN